MELIDREVYFWKYCDLCIHKELPDSEDPCDTCLEYESNVYSHKPINFEPKDPTSSIEEDR